MITYTFKHDSNRIGPKRILCAITGLLASVHLWNEVETCCCSNECNLVTIVADLSHGGETDEARRHDRVAICRVFAFLLGGAKGRKHINKTKVEFGVFLCFHIFAVPHEKLNFRIFVWRDKNEKTRRHAQVKFCRDLRFRPFAPADENDY